MEAIGQVDVLEPNQYSVEQKLKWLAVLDGQVFEELIRDYYEQAVKPGEYRTGEEELLIPMPYAQSIYCRYLQAMIAAESRNVVASMASAAERPSAPTMAPAHARPMSSMELESVLRSARPAV